MSDTGLDFGVLGPLQLRIDGIPFSAGTPKQRAVLATLILNRNRAVSSESLIAAAWEELPPPEAKAALYTYVANLRKLLGKGGAHPPAVLASAPPGYRLTIADTDCDLGRFSADKAAGVRAAAAGRFDDASRHLSAALAQWRGPVLDDLRDFAFVGGFATAMDEEKVSVQQARAEAEIACGRAHAVIGELEALTADHPYREPLWAQLITAYYVTARQADALDAYRRLKATLADDLGIDPSPPLRALQDRILNQDELDVVKVAQHSAAATATMLDQRTAVGGHTVTACLRDISGRSYPLQAAVTRLGRLPDNDIVLHDANVSRHHAAVIDTGSSFTIADLRSANGVYLQRERITAPALLADGDHIRICEHEFTFEINPTGG
jgi:DNA-binding SARP family transcriptional activator